MARPTLENAQNTKQLALDKMASLIQKNGYNGASMNAVAKEIGIRKASLYHHFPEGKEQLVTEMLERMIDFHAHGYQNAIDSGSTVQARLEALIRFNLAESSELSHVISDSLRFLQQQRQDHLGALFMNSQYLRVKQVLEDGVNANELREHDTALSTWMFLSLMGEMGALEEYISREDFPSRLVAMFLKGLGR